MVRTKLFESEAGRFQKVLSQRSACSQVARCSESPSVGMCHVSSSRILRVRVASSFPLSQDPRILNPTCSRSRMMRNGLAAVGGRTVPLARALHSFSVIK